MQPWIKPAASRGGFLYLLWLIAISFATAGLLSGQSAKPTAKKPASSAKPAAKKTPAKKPATRKSSKRTAAKPVPVAQQKPTKDRYAEIQQALAKAGFYSGEVNGIWGPESIEALRNFQFANGIEPTGKIDSKSLIRLGLGPNYENAATPPPDSADSTPAPPAG